jgi:hypothetical protein
MGVRILGRDDAVERFERLLNSRDWWCVPVISGAALDVGRAVEDRYYDGAASSDCEVMLGPLPPFGQHATMLFHKRRMTSAELGALLGEFGPGTDFEQHLAAGHDVLVIAEEQDR